MKRLFQYNSYKTYLKDLIESHGRGTIAHLANAAGCNRTYISQSLNSKVQLTADHILGIADYLGLSDEEQDFLMLLLLFERATTKIAQSKLKLRIEKLSQSELALEKKITKKNDSNELSETQKTRYYSSWKYAAIHTLTSSIDFQTPSALAKKLNLPDTETTLILRELADMDLIKNSGTKWVHSGKNIYLPTGSAHTAKNHLNWRLRAMEDVANRKAIHYTTIFTLSKSEWSLLKDQLLQFIDHQRDTIHKSGTDEMYCFCCDLFQPTEQLAGS